MEIQRLSLLNINPNKAPDRAKSPRPTRGSPSNSAGQSSRAEAEQRTSGEVLISVSSSVASSNDIDLSGHHLSFAVDGDTGDTVINVVDSENGEVIRQIPAEEVLKLRKKMGQMQGLLLDRRA